MEEKVAYIVKCRLCGDVYKLMLYPSDLERFYNREALIQDIFPYLSADERELIQTQTCPKCWDRMFKI